MAIDTEWRFVALLNQDMCFRTEDYTTLVKGYHVWWHRRIVAF